MSNSNEGSSDSLVIAEGKAEFEINSSEQKPPVEDDLFELSRDQPSLSFQIEEEQRTNKIRQICRQSKEDTLILNIVEPPPQENKKKRKQIFDKFKKPEKSIANKVDEQGGESNLLHIFDSIFRKKPVEPANFCGVYDSSHSRQLIKLNVENATNRSRTPSAQRRARLKIFGKKNTAGFQSVLPSNILEDGERVQGIKPTESKLFQAQSPIKRPKREDSLNLQTLQNRFSVIELAEFDYSRDSLEINNILESQIFREEQEEKKRTQGNNIKIEEEEELQQEPIKNLPTNISEPAQPQQQKQKQPIKVVPSPLLLEPSSFKPQTQSPLFKQQRSIYAHNQVEETKYLNNDISSLSSNPSVCVQNYQTFPNSMVNSNRRIFGQVSAFRVNDNKDNLNLLVQSRVVEQTQRTLINHVFQEENRLPIFLRKVRKHISVYPNLYILRNTPNTSEAINQQFKLLFAEFKKAISFLSGMCQKILDSKSKKQLYMEQLLETLSVESFLQSGWQKINQFDEDYELIKPMEPIDMRGWSYEKAKTALVNYENIVNYYENKGIKLDLNSDKGKKKYFEIRQKFWDICGNMKIISEDIFCEMRNCMFPSHYYEFHSFLKSPQPRRLNEKRLSYIRKLSKMYKSQRSQKDLLVNSAIGDQIRQKIDFELRYLAAF